MQRFQEQIAALDYILTGSIIKRFGPCGKENCNCALGKKYWHGPYYIWTRKENGKTITKSLSVAQVKLCRKAIGNMKKLKSILEKWKRESLKAVNAIIVNQDD